MKLEIDLAPIFEDKLGVDTVTLLEHLAQAWQENTDEVAMISALETALHLARDLEGNAGETVRTSRRTHNINWNATAERLFLKCVLGALIRKGLPKSDLLAKFNNSFRIFKLSLTGRFQIARCGVGPIPVAVAANTATKIPTFTLLRCPTGPSR
jgi:hypothetical protein